MRKPSVAGFDVLMFGAIFVLIVAGILFIYSSSRDATGLVYSNEYLKQIVWAVSGLCLFFLVSLSDYAKVARYAVHFYVVVVVLLATTLAVGRVVNGARSWLGFGDLGIQPSEFAKIATILVLGKYLEHSSKNVGHLPRFLGALGIVSVPVVLIVLQPDLGTALVYIPIFLFMAFMAGVQSRHLAYVFLFGLLTVILATMPSLSGGGSGDSQLLLLLNDAEMVRYYLIGITVITVLSALGYRVFRHAHFYWLAYSATLLLFSSGGAIIARRFLKDYQIMRLIIFLDPEMDPQGAGWNIIQSLTAVGSGGLFGKGYLRGTQSHYRYLPQQSTDFIFSILAEEIGFVGALFVIALFLLVLFRALWTLKGSNDDYAVLIGAGIVGMVFFHVVINIGMAIGIMPITGIPLLCLSYGGSSLWTTLVGVGILNSIRMSRYRH